MLRITMNKSAAGAKKYYSESYYSEGAGSQLDYYSEKDNSIGLWGGEAAKRLGLQGNITKEDFASLCDNMIPGTTKKLTTRNDADRTVGYDLTFNACKSVSLAYTFGSDADKRAILAALRKAVADTMKETERGMQARVRDKGKNENIETGNIAYGEFIHFTTRPVDGVADPSLHAHCFVFNATFDEQAKKWKAGQFRQINQDAPYYEAYFHSQLANNLEKIGYSIERTENGFELKGIARETIDKFSRRTKEIEDYAREHNITDKKQKAQIGAKTREAKRNIPDKENELKEWQSRLTHQEHLAFKNLKNSNGSAANDNNNANAAKEALDYSLNHHLERKSVASDKEILATAIKSSIGKTTPEQIKKEFSDSGVLSVKDKLRTFVTTKAALQEEKQLIQNASSLKGKFKPMHEGYKIQSDLLNTQQRNVVTHSLTTSDGLIVIVGKAGTGKTTLMLEVQQGIKEAGKKIFSFAPSSEASRVVQRNEGFENADTVASLLQKTSLHKEVKNQVIWIDEAGQLSNKDLNKVLEIAIVQNARVILSGDTKQHNSVERGDALRVIQKYAGIKSVVVNRIQRQKDFEYRQAVKLISEANIEKGFEKLDSIGAIKEIADNKERINTIANDYYNSTYKGKKPNDVLVIAPTHAEGLVVTNEIRNKLKENNIIKGEDKEVTILSNLQWTDAEKTRVENYKPGIIIKFHQNVQGIKAGSRFRMTEVKDGKLIACDSQGKEHQLSLDNPARFNIYQEKQTSIAIGDKIRCNENGKALDGKHLFNGTSFSVKGFNKKGVKLSNGSTIPYDYGHFNLGYVMTSHASQGKTTDKVIISQSSMSFRASSLEQFYVSVSRGKQAVAIYTDDKEGLLNVVGKSSQRISATELMQLRKASIEQSRLAFANRIWDKAANTVNKLKTSMSRNYELQGQNRAGTGKSR